MRGTIRIIENPRMVDTHTFTRIRPWRERLFSWPWRPLQKKDVVVTYTPSPNVINYGSTIICHPATAKALRLKLNNRDLI